MAQYMKKIANKDAKEIFSYVYKKNIWGDDESVSGSGSNKEQTREIVKKLPVLFRKYKIKSILDIPCGDFYWMRDVDLNGISYIGGDVVDELIAETKAKYETDGISFEVLDVIKDDLPKSDIVFVRDCFVHFSFEQIKEAIENIKRSGSKYLLTTSFVDHKENKDIIMGEWRRLNLETKPFNLKAIYRINEKCTQGNGRARDKSLILIEL